MCGGRPSLFHQCAHLALLTVQLQPTHHSSWCPLPSYSALPDCSSTLCLAAYSALPCCCRCYCSLCDCWHCLWHPELNGWSRGSTYVRVTLLKGVRVV
ncbi:hypothetical protein V8C86DRAFT_798780 [Haematococcus lacustris]